MTQERYDISWTKLHIKSAVTVHVDCFMVFVTWLWRSYID